MTDRLRMLAVALLVPVAVLGACGSEEPWAERVGMVSLGPVPTVTIPVVTIPASTTTTTTTAARATTAPPTITTLAPAVPTTSTTTEPPPPTSMPADPTPDVPFTVATATVELLETFHTSVSTEPWWMLPNPGPFSGARVLYVIGEVGEMLEVALPVRPNGTTGFVRSSDVSTSVHRARIVVDLGDHRITAWENGILVAEGSVALGADGTPTPLGEFYINEIQEQEDPDTIFGSWIIGLSGFSETLPLIDGMDPSIALHGTNDTSVLGTDVSEGCIRMHDDVAARLALLPPGTPVEIRS
ncbi:MAG: L,D-transpeptidase [Acidimicrobiia bacterium]|nr:L,D-transpeptidase [Actinomycetota bacterium]MBL6923908.1 L,D-transpeptidase [Acidimicrobiia bacterium]